MSNYTIIKTKTQYKEYSKKLMQLAAEKTSAKIQDEMELLDLLIEKWENDNLKNDDMDPIALLKYLMENHNMERNELIQVLGISKAALSQILNYKKGLSKNVIRKLAERFKLSHEAFNRPYKLISPANHNFRDASVMNTKKTLEHA
jgi:HTH-type transcriptional regulator/antitoxin HigA